MERTEKDADGAYLAARLPTQFPRTTTDWPPPSRKPSSPFAADRRPDDHCRRVWVERAGLNIAVGRRRRRNRATPTAPFDAAAGKIRAAVTNADRRWVLIVAKCTL